jgi:allantoinase
MKLIKNAEISTGENSITKIVDILFDEKIIQISEKPISTSDIEIYNLCGKLLIPGCIDAHVHFNDPGFTHHEDFLSGTSSAAAGGITTIIDMPCTSIPAVTNTENLNTKLEVIKPKAVIDFALWAGLSGNNFPLDKSSILELWNAGVVGFKIYTVSGMDTFKALTYEQIKTIFNEFPELLFAFHAEDPEVLLNSKKEYSDQELSKPETFVYSRPPEAEITAVKKILQAAGKQNIIHIVHVGSSKAAELIQLHKEKLDLTWETCPHYLQFTCEDFSILKGKLKTAPSVKFKEDKGLLRSYLKSGDLDFVTTDHAGCDWKTEKDIKDFSKVYSGIPGTELMIPYLFSEFYQKEKVQLLRMIELTSTNAAKRYGLYPQKGSLEIGSDADFTVIDLNRPNTIDEQKLYCLGKYSPFHRETFGCSIDKTIVRGNIVYDSGKDIIGKPGWGKWVKRES